MGRWRAVTASDRAPIAPASSRFASDGLRLGLDWPRRRECVPLISRCGRQLSSNRRAEWMADGLTPSAPIDGLSCAQGRAGQHTPALLRHWLSRRTAGAPQSRSNSGARAGSGYEGETGKKRQ